MSSARILALAAGLLLSACTDEYAEGPANAPPVTYETAQQVAAEEQPTIIAINYPMSQGGDVRVAAYGLVAMGSQTQSAQHISALRVRLTLENRSGGSWTLDTRDQKVDLPGYGTSVAAFASADPGSSPPAIVVEPGGHRVVDLFFPVPAQLQAGAAMPQKFDVLWRVQTGSGPVAQRTTIDEGLAKEQQQQQAQAAQPYYDYNDYDEGIGAGPTWYNPYYPYYGFGIAVPPVYVGGPLWFHHYGYWGHPHYYGHGYGHGLHGGYFHGYHGGGFHGGRFHGGGFHGGGFHGGGFHGGGGHGGHR